MRKIFTKKRYCLICKNEIIRGRTSPRQYNKSKFCSKKCRGKWQSINAIGKNSSNYRGGKSICIDCGDKLAYRYSYRDTKRCRKCYHKLLKTNPEISPNWKGGKRVDKSGYILIYQPSHPYASGNCVREHRLIIEKHLNRYLSKSEVVHHIDGNKSNNVLTNLKLCKSQKEHRKLHKTAFISS